MNIRTLAMAAVAAAVAISSQLPRTAWSGDDAPPSAKGGAAHELAVVELFMSQACGSCPPAVEFMGELATGGDVIALTWPVDYFDYTGWKDTFASPENSRRQRAYNDQLGLRYLYTPQIFVNGASQAVGSDREDVMAAVEEPAKRLRVDIDIKQDGDSVTIHLPSAPAALPATVWLMRYDHIRQVDIAGGENAGRTMLLRNVVRDTNAIGTWNGEAKDIVLNIPDLMDGNREACAILVQTQGVGPIIGAATLDFASLDVN
ncbi:MAG: DUF1223 domain-containing protein [Sphingomonadales bacterium]